MRINFEIEDRGNGIKWVRLYKQQQIYDISVWCNEHGCGKQVNIHTISFKKDEELMMFLLKWQSELQ